MAFTVQDDTGTVDGANSYIDVAFADDYFTDRGNATWLALSVAVKQSSLIAATDYIDKTFVGKFKGSKLTGTQSTQWPRAGAVDSDGFLFVGIPEILKEATSEYASRASVEQLDPDPATDDSGLPLKGFKNVVGPISEQVEYQSGFYTPIRKRYPAADNLLKDLLIGGGIVNFLLRA